MYNPTKRQKEIIDVSIGLIAESGIQNLTIRNISEKIRISEPAIYRHYNSKLDIILSILEFFGNNSKFMLDKLDSEDISPLKKLEKLYLKRCKEFSEKPEITRVLFSEEIFQNEKILSEKVKEIMTIHRNFIKKTIVDGQNNEVIRKDVEPEHICNIVLGSLRLIVTMWRLSDYGFDLCKYAQSQWDSLKILVGKEN